MGKDLKKLLDDMDLENEGSSSKEKRSKKQVPKMLKSKGIVKAKVENQPLGMRMEQEERKKKKKQGKNTQDQKDTKSQIEKAEKKRAIQQAVLFKSFNTEMRNSESDLYKLLDEKDKNKLSKSGKKRKDKRKSILRKKIFKEYLAQARTNNKADSGMNLESLKDSLKKIEDVHKKFEEKKNKKKHHGVSNKEKAKASIQELSRFKKILNFQPFLSNPLDTIRTHIINSQQANMKH